jgi:antitoxin VapB
MKPDGGSLGRLRQGVNHGSTLLKTSPASLPEQADAVTYAEGSMNAIRHVKLFQNGRNQAVRIPVEFELPGEDAPIQRDGDRLVIEPLHRCALWALIALRAILVTVNISEFIRIERLEPENWLG